MKIYISGPITGRKNYKEHFEVAEEALTKEGHEVINPVKVNAQLPKGTTYQEYMKLSFAMLDLCDGIFVLNGWKTSWGASQELLQAIKSGHTVIFEGGRGCEKANQKAAV